MDIRQLIITSKGKARIVYQFAHICKAFDLVRGLMCTRLRTHRGDHESVSVSGKLLGVWPR